MTLWIVGDEANGPLTKTTWAHTCTVRPDRILLKTSPFLNYQLKFNLIKFSSGCRDSDSPMGKWIMWDVTNDCTKIWHWHWSDVDRTWSKAESKTTRINAALFHVVIFFGRFVGNLFLPKNFRTKSELWTAKGRTIGDWLSCEWST